MHPARPFHTTDPATLIARARAHPFALLICGEVVTHTPVLTAADGTMRFHIAKTNAIAAPLAGTARATLVFTGPHAYISPSWYDLPDQVGTWNYTSVEASGPLTALPDPLPFLHDLAAAFDAAPPDGKVWTKADIVPEKLARLTRAITAYQLTPQRLEGTTKLNQDKPPEARKRVMEELASHPLAALMRDTL